MHHTTKVQKKNAGSQREVQLLQCITDYKGVVSSQSDGKEPPGFALVPETVQVIRVELLQEMLRAGIKSHRWNKVCTTVPGFTYVLRAVLTNSPNSCPPESLFTIFNATYDDDQKSSYTDYIQFSMFNKRVL